MDPIRAERLVDEALSLVDNAAHNQASVNKAKAQAAQRNFMAGKIDRETWGEQVEQKVTLNIGELHLNALRALKEQKALPTEIIVETPDGMAQ